jgi:nitrite reductase/ring-hydroxylating ferredoxin subunit
MAELFVAKLGDFKEGDRRIVRSPKGEIGVFHHGGAFYAYANNCVHSGGPACEGITIPKVVDIIAEDKTYHGQTFDENEMHFVCPWHGYEYDLKTGTCIGDPRLKLRRYDVVQRDDTVYVIA